MRAPQCFPRRAVSADDTITIIWTAATTIPRAILIAIKGPPTHLTILPGRIIVRDVKPHAVGRLPIAAGAIANMHPHLEQRELLGMFQQTVPGRQRDGRAVIDRTKKAAHQRPEHEGQHDGDGRAGLGRGCAREPEGRYHVAGRLFAPNGHLMQVTVRQRRGGEGVDAPVAVLRAKHAVMAFERFLGQARGSDAHQRIEGVQVVGFAIAIGLGHGQGEERRPNAIEEHGHAIARGGWLASCGLNSRQQQARGCVQRTLRWCRW